jgi:hypothetical protein
MTSALPPHVTRDLVRERLKLIFPPGSPHEKFCTRDIGAAVVFTALYIGAIEGSGVYLGPKHVYRMCDEQAARGTTAARVEYATEALRGGFVPLSQPWYADNSREGVRDESIRQGYIPVRAMIANKAIATTSSRPRYALTREFAALFDPALEGPQLEGAAAAWRATHLSPNALARVRLVQAGATATPEGVLVTFPSGETRRLQAGPSSRIAKAVVEEFAPRFLEDPAVVWMSESGNKVAARDDRLAKQLRLEIDAQKTLPDIILADLRSNGGPVVLVFVEVVATDGAVTVNRKAELLRIAESAGYESAAVAFVTAFEDRSQQPARKNLGDLAWNSFAWFASEPEHIVAFVEGTAAGPKLHALLDRG